MLRAILIYNGLVQRRLRIDEAFAQIEVQLKRRWDLIPNLVDAVKGYMGFEQKVLTDVTRRAPTPSPPAPRARSAQAAAENALTSTLRSLFAVVENYPELKANQNVLELQEQLTTTENQISFARQHYNATVLDYNSSIATFPNVLIAGPLGFTRARLLRRRAAGLAGPGRRPRLRRGRRRASAAAAAAAARRTGPPAAPGPPSSRPRRPPPQGYRRQPSAPATLRRTRLPPPPAAPPPPRLRPPPPRPPRQG